MYRCSAWNFMETEEKTVTLAVYGTYFIHHNIHYEMASPCYISQSTLYLSTVASSGYQK
jgi:hypothetical protein